VAVVTAERLTAGNEEGTWPRRGAVERLAAWLRLGPLGHLWSALADLVVYVARDAAQRTLLGRGIRRSPRR
jgi:hypothetical protein